GVHLRPAGRLRERALVHLRPVLISVPFREVLVVRRILILLTALVTALAPVLGVSPPHARAATAVCALYCDTRDPSLAQQETFPTPNVSVNNRVVELHVDDVDGMAWASIDNG